MKISPHTIHQPTVARELTPDQPVRLVSLLLALLTVLIYLPVGFHDFIDFDDPSYVTDNAIVQNGLSWPGLQWAFIGWHASNWHPLTWLSHQLDCQLFGLNPGAHHLVNVLFHAANTLLLFQLWWRLTHTLWPSALVAALFAWHPLHVESVAWVAERKDVLSTFFGLLAIRAFVRYVAESNVQSPQSKLSYTVSLGWFALALLSKPMLVTLPFLLLLLDYWPLARWPLHERTHRWRLVGEKAPFLVLSALSCVCTFLAQRPVAVATLRSVSLGLRLENSLVAGAAYLGKTLWPVNLCIFYPLPPSYAIGTVILCGAILLAITTAAWYWRRNHRYLLTGWLWFLGMLVPVIGLVQVGDQAMADRYLYLPAVGLFVAAAFGLAEAQAHGHLPGRTLGLGAGLILVACVAITERQLTYWRDAETLFTHALAVTGRNAPAEMMLGIAWEKQGRWEAARQAYEEALAMDESLMIQVAGGEKRPLAAQLKLIAGEDAEQKGQTETAMACYRAAVRLAPEAVEAHNNLGNLLDQSGRPNEALAEYQTAARLRPEAPRVHENLGTQLSELGQFEAALAEYQNAARLAPNEAHPYYLMGKAWLRNGDRPAALTALQNALRLNPQDIPTLVCLARVLATDESPQIRNGPQAVALAEQANQLTGGTQPLVLGTLAMAYAETGRFKDARQTVQAAINAAQDASAEMQRSLKEQLKRYEANQPFRQSFTHSLVP